MEWNEENIEKFIQENRDKFDKHDASTYHGNIFLKKLYVRFKKFIDISPHLYKLSIVISAIFIVSLIIWFFWLREQKYVVETKQKIENIICPKNE